MALLSDEPHAEQAAGGPSAARVFEPMAVTAEYAAPPVSIHPDASRGWIRRLGPLVRSQLPLILVALAAAVVSTQIQVRVPRLVGQAVSSLYEEIAGVTITGHSVGYYAVRIAVLAGVFGLSQMVFRYFLMRIGYRLEFFLRVLMFQKLMGMPFSYFDTVQTGQMVSRANSDIRMVQMFLQMAPMIGVSLVTFVFVVWQMVQIDIGLTFASMGTLPMVYVLGSKMQRHMFPVSWLMSSRMAEIATVVEENVGGAEVVRSFTAEAQQISLVDRAARRLRWVAIRQAEIRSFGTPLMQNLPRVGNALILLYGGWLVTEGRMEVGQIVEFNGYTMMIQMPFMMLGMLMMMAQRAQASAERIYEVLDAEPDLQERPGAADLVECRGDVRFDDVVFSYRDGSPIILDGFDLHLRPGETVALVGRTGRGKSTVARLIARFYDVDRGSVRIDGRDVSDLTFSSLRSHVGLVLDDSFLFSGTIRENIAFGRPDASDEDIEQVARAAGAEDFIHDMPDGFDTVVGERGSTLSGGQRQRIAIARTLLVNPRVLILDDCTSAIDPHREHEIHGALRTLMTGRTTLVIAHRPSTISLANRVVVLDGGRIVADGTHEELMTASELYREILSHAEELDQEHSDEDEAPDLRAVKLSALAAQGGPDRLNPDGFGDDATRGVGFR